MSKTNDKFHSSAASQDEVLVQVEGVSKKFCRSLKKSLWYGLQDIAHELNPFVRRIDRSSVSVDSPPPSANDPQLTHNQKPSVSNHLRPEEFWAVHDVSFQLRRGECLGLIGHNGAGKTTLLKMLNGLIKPDYGRIEMRGRVGALIALGAGFNPILTGRENIYVNASILGLSRREIDEKINEIIDFSEIGEFIDSPVQSYSSGMAVRLGFAVASALKPSVLLLDEVLAVGDVGFQAKCFNRLADLRQIGVAFILVSHNMHQISRYCQNVLYLQRGKVHFSGNVDDGIGQFLNDMREFASPNSNGPDWSVINGSGKVVFTGADFLGSDGTRIDKLQAGSPLRFEVSFERRSATDVIDPVLDVVILCRGECIFQSTNRERNQLFGALPKSGRFCVSFDNIPCNDGPLEFYFCLLDGESNELYDWKRNLLLEVSPSPYERGIIRLAPNWQVTSTQLSKIQL